MTALDFLFIAFPLAFSLGCAKLVLALRAPDNRRASDEGNVYTAFVLLGCFFSAMMVFVVLKS